MFIDRISGRQLGSIALGLWCCSLFLTGLALRFRQVPGYEILAVGWLSPLVVNFAWYANVFFLYGFFRLRAGRVPVVAALIATILSFDTFRVTEWEGGGGPVYEYGWGAILWFLAIFMLLAAVGLRSRETNTSASEGEYEHFNSIGWLLIVVMLAFTSVFAIYDRVKANPAEARQLTHAAFKRGEVCSAPEPEVTNPIRDLSGPVKLVIDKRLSLTEYPLARIDTLLDWGIPALRITGADYSYETFSSEKMLTKVRATGASSAVLYVSEPDESTIKARLVETQTDRVVFEQIWKKEKGEINAPKYFCPDYQSFPRSHEQPRKLVMEALGLTLEDTHEMIEEKSTKLLAPLSGELPATTQMPIDIFAGKIGTPIAVKISTLWSGISIALAELDGFTRTSLQ